MSDITDEYIIRALVALIRQQDLMLAKLEKPKKTGCPICGAERCWH